MENWFIFIRIYICSFRDCSLCIGIMWFLHKMVLPFDVYWSAGFVGMFYCSCKHKVSQMMAGYRLKLTCFDLWAWRTLWKSCTKCITFIEQYGFRHLERMIPLEITISQMRSLAPERTGSVCLYCKTVKCLALAWQFPDPHRASFKH